MICGKSLSFGCLFNEIFQPFIKIMSETEKIFCKTYKRNIISIIILFLLRHHSGDRTTKEFIRFEARGTGKGRGEGRGHGKMRQYH